MTIAEKEKLLNLLTEKHYVTCTILKGIDLDTIVYTDTGWRIRDILGHIATWDRQVARSIRAYRSGTEYFIPDHDEDEFNRLDILRQQALTDRQVFSEWEEAREDFRKAVQEVPDDLFLGDLIYPWGDERGTIAKLVKTMAKHDEEHHAEILNAIRTSLGS